MTTTTAAACSGIFALTWPAAFAIVGLAFAGALVVWAITRM
jgi:hypothetical protein